ncbi:MAG: anhydro-N-acetylmuramic acid kinase [Mycobacteriales bacterium]
MRIAGLISGTSYDGVDVAVVEFDLDGTTLHARIALADTVPYPAEVVDALQAAQHPRPVTAAAMARLDTLVGQAFAAAAAEADSVAGPLALLCSHGQTVYHWVDDDGRAKGTLQVGEPAWIAHATGVPVISGVRAADIAADGQGAPLVPLLDLLLLAGLDGNGPAAALNIGGIANLTVAADPPLGYDTGPGNCLLDLIALEATGRAYDVDGMLASQGTADTRVLGRLLADPYFARRPPKSTGREHFDAAFLARHRDALPPADLAATLTALTAETIAAEVNRYGVRTLVASGGGIDNPVLREMLADRIAGTSIHDSNWVGVPPEAKEAVLFALIGWYSWHGLPAGVPSCTGASATPVLGSFTPGSGPLRLPAPLDSAPERLVFD